jgi:hypothetical protein
VQRSSRILPPMLANLGQTVKGLGLDMRRLVRALLRVVIAAGIAAGIAALARAVLGRLAGEPNVPGEPNRSVPMSLDSWPPVPQAPAPDQA